MSAGRAGGRGGGDAGEGQLRLTGEPAPAPGQRPTPPGLPAPATGPTPVRDRWRVSGEPVATRGEVVLGSAERDALSGELFALWETAEPGTHKCFCGSDAQLVDAVRRARERTERELEREDEEPGR